MAEINMSDIKNYLKQMTEIRKQMSPRPKGFRYHCLEEFVLKNGKEFKEITQNDVQTRTIKECFRNALMVSQETGLIYVEGYALGIIPVIHAWCVDLQGTVFDVTWKKGVGTQYFGVPFDPDYIMKTYFSKTMYGMLENYEQGFPLMKTRSRKFIHEKWR